MKSHKNKASIPPDRKKPKKDHVKSGPKADNEKLEQIKKLRELFDQDGITPWRASIIVGCGYDFARQQFKVFADEIVEKESEDWIETNERVRKRALEGIASKIELQKKSLTNIQRQIRENEHMQRAGLDEAEAELKQTEVYKMIQDYLQHMDEKAFTLFVTVMRKYIDTHKTYGFLVAQFVREERASQTFLAELQQQYDAIEIMPPPKAVLDAMLEKKIAEKQKMFAPAIFNQEKE